MRTGVRLSLWFAAGAGLAAAGNAIALGVGNGAAGILVGVTVLGGTMLGTWLSARTR